MGQSQPINRFPVLNVVCGLSEHDAMSSKDAAILERMGAAQTKAFEQSGEDEQNYLDWLAAWSLEQDPVAYAFGLMEQADRQNYVNSLSAAEKKRLVASLQTAHRLGICSPPGWGPSE